MNDTDTADPRPTVGILHPGEMGAAVAGCLAATGVKVVWASAGRSAATRDRAERAGLLDVGTAATLAGESDIVLSVCPPSAAVDVARSLPGFGGIYVDANAVSPATARQIAQTVGASGATYVDGGIIGPAPGPGRTTRLYLSGGEAGAVARLFAGTPVVARIIDGAPTAASALKMVYAAWTKGSAALLLATVATAKAQGVWDDLQREWEDSQPALEARAEAAARSAARKGWRWSGEMEEVAATFAAAKEPDGFHLAAAELFGRLPRPEGE